MIQHIPDGTIFSAVPHYLAVDDDYRGYKIPAGSIVNGTAWFVI
jgi:hypothetical protein